ncbi:MAG: hypothetical protein R2941_02365 [Desulfobacterales bacterium]
MRFMKSIMIASLAMVMSMGMFGQVFAKGGFGQGQGQGNGMNASCTNPKCQALADGTCPAANIFDGEAVTVTGTVSEIQNYRQGVQIDTGTETVTVYGLGPVWYWEQLDADYPAVGDTISVSAYNVTLSDGSVKTVAASVSVGEETIALRDADTGLPLWRGHGRGQGFRGKCPFGTAPATEAAE